MSYQRSLGLGRLTALVVGNMLGSGTFMLPAALAHYGTIGLLGWLVTGAGAICLALIFGRLSMMVTNSGGPYAFCRAAYGEFVGFQIAYCYWIAIWIGNSALLVASVAALSVFWPALNTNPGLGLAVSLGVLWLITLINMCGLREAGIMQVIMTVAKVLPIVALALVGFWHVHPSHWKQFNVSGVSNWHALGATITLTLWSFIGFESATVPSEAAINPRRTIPIATVAGTSLVAVIYIVVTAAIMGLIPMATLAKSPAPFAMAAGMLWGPIGRYLMALVALIACVGTLNGWVLMQGQVSMAVAKDKMFPPLFAKQSPNGTPAWGIAVGSLCISGLMVLRYGVNLVDQFTFIISLAVLASLVPYLYSAMAELVLRMQPAYAAKDHGSLRASIVLAILGFIYAFWAVKGAGQDVVYDGMLLILSSLPVYLLMRYGLKSGSKN